MNAAPIAHAADWVLSAEAKDGLPIVKKAGATAVASNFAFWGQNWQWAGQTSQFGVIAPYQYRFGGKNERLGFDLSGEAQKRSDAQLDWIFRLNLPKSLTDVIGGGVVFNFDLATFGAEMGAPELLPENRGWSWGRGANRIEMRFDPPLMNVHFDRGQKSSIRAFFFQSVIPQGQYRWTAKVSLRGMTIGPSETERYGPVAFDRWNANAMDLKSSPFDLSYLNQPEIPAGKRGFVQVRGEHLAFEDGSPARFWGTNLAANALFTTPRDVVKAEARRLSELGFNLVRLHHHDSFWVNPNIYGDRAQAKNSQTPSPAMLEKLDWWIKCLKDEGIYVWLDLHVQRHLQPGDAIDGFEEIAKGKPGADLKGYNYVNPSIQQAMKNFSAAYLNHVNTFTGLAYKSEPAIAGLLITNENDVTHHFGNALLPDKKVPHHNAWYQSQADAFAAKSGLPKDKVWRAWEPGPAKLFLNDLEYRFNVDMLAHLKSLGVKVPVATTSTWGGNPLSSLPALTAGQIIDVHSYGKSVGVDVNPLYAPNFMHWIAAGKVAGMPLSVTEWNIESFPSPDRHIAPLYLAAYAGLNGWNAMMQFAYAQGGLGGPGSPSNWHAFNDPASLALMPAAALMYREGHVQESKTVYAISPSREQLFGQALSPTTSVALRTAAERGRVVVVLPAVPELPWLKKILPPAGSKVISDPSQSQIASGAQEVVSDTGELARSWAQGVQTVDTPRTQAALGWLGGQKIVLKDVEFALRTPHAGVVVQGVDGKPISSSRRLLISMGSRTLLQTVNRLPYLSEPLSGELFVRAPAGLKLYKKTASGLESLPTKFEGGRYRITLDPSLKTYWLSLR